MPCVAVSSTLGLGPLRTVLDLQLGGQAPCHLVWQAAQAVARGDAEVVVVYRALNGRSGPRVGSMHFAGMGGQYRYPIGYGAYLMYVGMWAQRFLHETGQGPEDLGAVAVSQRWYAERNERALRREPLDARGRTWPSRSWSTPTAGRTARRGRRRVRRGGDLARAGAGPGPPPAVVASGCYRAGPRPGLDIGDHLLWEDYTRNYTWWLADELFGRAGVAPGDVQVAEIYDCFTSTVLVGLEGLGLCGRGESGAFVRRGMRDRRAPSDQHRRRAAGRGLPARDEHGGRGGAPGAGPGRERQAPRHEVAVVTSGALMDGSALILTADR